MTARAMAQHPRLLLTPETVTEIRQELGSVPVFDAQMAEAVSMVNAAIDQGIDVPIPVDMAGGYTHERHKRNWLLMQQAGVLYQFTEDKKYAEYVREMLLAYAEMYPTLGLHPAKRSYSPGKLFWQCLNDANWLVSVSQAYDCIYEFLSEEERELLERDLFRPYADFLSVENPQFFNRIHNHSTWACAALGMIGLVLEDEEIVSRALYGLRDSSIQAGMLDNDGGMIRKAGEYQAGFLAQMEGSFSPDGYFTEGPYYLRYAIFPFLLFSASLDQSMPELDILGYHDSILRKAVYALLNQTDANGLVFPINDAQKGMSWKSRDIVTAVDLAYHLYDQDPELLSIAQLQGWVTLDPAGFRVSKDLQQGLAKPIHRNSVMYRDGAQGTQGGIGILRAEGSAGHELCLVMKYSAQGGGHGHFDKLSYSLYGPMGEIVQDYGSVRWVNIDQKGGGTYLPENNSWAKQSIAHNTVTVDQTTQYQGKIQLADANQPYLFAADILHPEVQYISARDSNAYPGVMLHRSMVLIADSGLAEPIVVDLFRVESDSAHTYDLPLWYTGHLLTTNMEFEQLAALTPMGKNHGYQHMWLEGQGVAGEAPITMTWFANGTFYSMISVATPGDLLISTFLGADDPNHNLRRDPALLIRKKDQADALFVNVVEPHGSYSPVLEIPKTPYGVIKGVEVILNNREYSIVSIHTEDGTQRNVMIANRDNDPAATHEVTAKDQSWTWTGPFHYMTNNK